MKRMNNIVSRLQKLDGEIWKITHVVVSLDSRQTRRAKIATKLRSEPFAEREPLNSFHGQLQLAFMPRFAYRCETISRALGLISVSDAFPSCKKRS